MFSHMAAAVLPSPTLGSRQRLNSTSRTPTSPSILNTREEGTFNRIRTSLNTLRNGVKKPGFIQHQDEFGTITPKGKGKEKETNSGSNLPKERSRLRRLSSKMDFRRKEVETNIRDEDPIRAAGFTSALTPSLRMASMSDPNLPIHSQSIIGTPSPLRPTTKSPSRSHRPSRSNPPLTSSTTSLTSGPQETRRTRGPPPSPPSPSPTSRGAPLARSSSRTAAQSSSNLTDNLQRTASRRAVNPPPVLRGLTSSSTTNLPITTSPRRPSFEIPRSPTRLPSNEYPRHPPLSPDNQRQTSGESPRRPSLETQRRPSVDSPRQQSSESPPLMSRGPSPLRAQTATPSSSRLNGSTISLVAQPTAAQREAVRSATSLICREITRALSPPAGPQQQHDAEEAEFRMRGLARLERIWGKSGAGGSTITVNASMPMSSSGAERELKLFADALRDGFVLCHLLNRVRGNAIVRPDPRDDGFVRTANVTRFLAACASVGLQSSSLFQRDDLIDGSGESLARVAATVIALVQYTDSPPPDQAKSLIRGGSLYKASGRAAASTPNLLPAKPSSPISPRRKYSPTNGTAPKVGSISPEPGGGSSVRTSSSPAKDPPLPPRSPLRTRASSSRRAPVDEPGAVLFTLPITPKDRSSIADSTLAAPGTSVRGSVVSDASGPSVMMRDSRASSAMTDSTAFSSLLDGRGGRFATIRTVATDVTSAAPSMSRTEGESVAAILKLSPSSPRLAPPSPDSKDEPTPTQVSVDLSRVEEEVTPKGKGRTLDADRERMERVRLGKGKWPEDFIDIGRSKPLPIPSRSRLEAEDDFEIVSSPLSISPPRKVSWRGSEGEGAPPPPLTRRPIHRARHSVDTPGLLPKVDVLRGRDLSPDSNGVIAAPRVMLRRSSTKGGAAQRGGVYIPRGGLEPEKTDSTSPVPFPKTANSDLSDSTGSASGEGTVLAPKPVDKRLRGRFLSEVDGAASIKRTRPTSYEEIGARPPMRTRFESMANIGRDNGSTAVASDFMGRNSVDGGVVRKTLVVKEEGKPPTHFQLGNCIGRGQFGSVYRALNLNTGQMVAVKRIRLEGLAEKEVTQLMGEVDLVKSLSHPSIVKYEGMARDEDTLSIVLEYAENGSLGQTLKAFGKLNEKLVASYVVKILEGLYYLHGCDVVHCDLKAANILTTKNGNIKLSDFGVSLNLRAMEGEIKDVAGTPNWMAPEVIELKGASPKSDIWSLGCTVVELLTGHPPYSEIANSMSVMFRIVDDDVPPIPEGCSELLQDFLRQCFHKDSLRRPSADVLCEHPWLKQNWGQHKQLRPQDSIPFLRRVSADLQKSEVVKYLAQIEMPEPSSVPSAPSPLEQLSGSPSRCQSHSSLRPAAENDVIGPREHSFVKTTFSKPMICRVCLLQVKKNAVLCAQCSLIAHSKCASHAPPTCDLRAQLLLYAQYAEKGNPGSAYSNPMDGLNENYYPGSPVSDVAYVPHSARTSVDGRAQASPPPTPHPPTAFRFVPAVFKRSKSSLTSESVASETSSVAPLSSRGGGTPLAQIRQGEASEERPQSLASNSTNQNSPSMRSAATAAESFSSARRPGSIASVSGTDQGARLLGSRLSAGGSRITITSGPSEISEHQRHYERVPGEMPQETRRHKKKESKSSNNGCTLQ